MLDTCIIKGPKNWHDSPKVMIDTLTATFADYAYSHSKTSIIPPPQLLVFCIGTSSMTLLLLMKFWVKHYITWWNWLGTQIGRDRKSNDAIYTDTETLQGVSWPLLSFNSVFVQWHELGPHIPHHLLLLSSITTTYSMISHYFFPFFLFLDLWFFFGAVSPRPPTSPWIYNDARVRGSGLCERLKNRVYISVTKRTI